MIRLAAAARWIAIAIAVAALIDPELSIPRLTRPVVRVLAQAPHDARPLEAQLRNAGFAIDPTHRETATVLIGDRATPASGFQLPASGFQLPASGSQLPASSSQLPTSG